MVNSFWRFCAAAWLVLGLGACGGGGSSGSGSTQSPSNAAPSVHILASGDARATASGTGLSVSVGGLVHLDGGTSSDADNDSLSYEWSLTAKPPGSTLSISSPTAAQIDLRPDLIGTYQLLSLIHI